MISALAWTKTVSTRKVHEPITVEAYDRSYCANLWRYIESFDIQWAYEYLQYNGIHPNSVKIEGMIALYNWIYREMQISDTVIKQKNIKQKVCEIFWRYHRKKQQLTYQEISNKLETDIFEYYTNFVNQAHYKNLTMPIPSWILSLSGGIHPDSPLAKVIQSIILPSSCNLS